MAFATRSIARSAGRAFSTLSAAMPVISVHKPSARYDITSVQNPAIKELLRIRRKRRERREQGVALIRGRRLIQAVGEFFPFKQIFTHEDPGSWGGYRAERILRTERAVLEHVLFPKTQAQREHARQVTDDDFILGTIDQPQPVEDFEEGTRWLLAVDSIKHPENMALLLSTAVALKYDGVAISASCVDPFNYKVLEASQAVAWTLPYRFFDDPSELLAICRRHNLEPCAADARGTYVSDLPARTEGSGFCLTLGSESSGVQPTLLAQCTRVALPMSDLSDSLNAGVAGGVLMHALACAWGRS